MNSYYVPGATDTKMNSIQLLIYSVGVNHYIYSNLIVLSEINLQSTVGIGKVELTVKDDLTTSFRLSLTTYELWYFR